MPKPQDHTKTLKPCHDPNHRGGIGPQAVCATCNGTGIVEFDHQTGELTPCYRNQGEKDSWLRAKREGRMY